MNSMPLAKYNALIDSGILQPDSGQADVVARLNSLNQMLKPTSFTQIFKKKPSLRGIYIHGDVGRGKSMLMDLFYESAEEKRKRSERCYS